MYICICKNITDGQIRKAIKEKGVSNMRGLRQELGACGQCGKCAVEAREIMRECLDPRGLADSRRLEAA